MNTIDKSWAPMCAVNADLDKLKYPVYISKKLEGVRAEFTPTGLLTRPLKKFGNNNILSLRFQKVLDFCATNNVIIEGEFYLHGIEFSNISGCVRGRGNPLAAKLQLHIFDTYQPDYPNKTFSERYSYMQSIAEVFKSEDFIIVCEQKVISNKQEAEEFYFSAIDEGYEGVCFKGMDSSYKKGRSTKTKGEFSRIKPLDTFDGKVIEIVERLENLCESEYNELGKLSKRQDKDMKAHTGLAAVAVVECKDFPRPVRVSLTRGIMDYEDTSKSPSRHSIWHEEQNYIGRHLKFVATVVPGMELPRSPRFDEWRTDLD